MYKIITKKEKDLKMEDLDSLKVVNYKIPNEINSEFLEGDIVFFYDETLIRVYKSNSNNS